METSRQSESDKEVIMEDYVTYEQAVKLKELGFNWGTMGKYVDCPKDPTLFHGMIYQIWNLEKDQILAPTLSQAAKWLREKWQLHISVDQGRDLPTATAGRKCDERHFWIFKIFSIPIGSLVDGGYRKFTTYESALSEGIDKALEKIKG